MISIKGVPVSVKLTKKGKNNYMFALPNNNIAFVITSKTYELMKPVEVVASSYLAANNRLYLIE